jgi:hypothetical protein
VVSSLPGGKVLWTFYAACLALAVILGLAVVGRYARAGRATRWTCTRVEPGEVKVVYHEWMHVYVHVPQGANLVVAGPPALVLAVSESGRLWLTGDLRARGTMIAGIPDVPVVGQVRAVKRSR